MRDGTGGVRFLCLGHSRIRVLCVKDVEDRSY